MSRRPGIRRTARLAAALSLALTVGTVASTATVASGISAPTLYARNATAGTSFLNHTALLGSINDKPWFEANIPFLDVPDTQIRDVYYYRWQTYKEHLVYTGPEYGYLSNEFLQPVSYGAPYGGVVAAAGPQITEGRWLRSAVRERRRQLLAGGARSIPEADGRQRQRGHVRLGARIQLLGRVVGVAAVSGDR